MTGSSLQEVLEFVYAHNTVSQIMSGKAVQRVTRGYMMVDNTVLLLEKGLLLKQMELYHGEIDAHEYTSSIEKN